ILQQPRNQHPHFDHGECKCQEEREPIPAVRSRCAQIVDRWKVPQAPQNSQPDCCGKCTAAPPHLGKSKAAPTDFFEDTSRNSKRDAQPEVIWRECRRNSVLKE